MKEHKISIIVPIYNAGNSLEKCIESLISQSYSNLEIILINDGSTDYSLDICKKYSDKDKRIITIDKENGGVASARNAGLEVVTGDFIGFVDSDDYIAESMYENLLNALLDNEAEISECGYYKVNLENGVIEEYSLQNEIITNSYNCVYNYLNKINTTNHNWNKLYKRNIFDNIRYSDFKYSEDYVVNVKAFSKCKKKVVIDGCYYYQVIHGGNVTSKKFNERKLDIIKAGQEAIEFCNEIYPDLSGYIIVYILINIRKLYIDLTNSKISFENKFKNILTTTYNDYYSQIKNNLFFLVKSKGVRITLYLFYKNPKVYYYIETLRRGRKLKNFSKFKGEKHGGKTI